MFDMDGLLLDSERVIMQAWLAAAQQEGLMLSEPDFLLVVGVGAEESRARLTKLLGGQEGFRRVRERARARLAAAPGVVFPLKPGALALLRQLRQRRCAVCGGLLDPCGRGAARLAKVEVLDFFQVVAGGDEVARSKPDPAVYLLAAERLGVAPARCLAFEDSDPGAVAAHQAGLRVVVVPDLKAHDFGAAYMQLFSLKDALAHIDRWFAARANAPPATLGS